MLYNLGGHGVIIIFFFGATDETDHSRVLLRPRRKSFLRLVYTPTGMVYSEERNVAHFLRDSKRYANDSRQKPLRAASKPFLRKHARVRPNGRRSYAKGDFADEVNLTPPPPVGDLFGFVFIFDLVILC